MNNCGIIFDCDGTLVNSLALALESFHFALAQVGEKPRPTAVIKQYFGAGADRILAQIIGDEQKGAQAFHYYLEHQSLLAAQTQLHVGIRDLLDQLADAEIPMAVVTGRHAHDLELVLASHRLSDYFITLVADNHAPKSKPAPDGILMAAQRMALAPAHTLYVGDALYDIQAAHAAGSIAVAALWDELADADQLAAAHPAFMANTPQDVLTFFNNKFERSR